MATNQSRPDNHNTAGKQSTATKHFKVAAPSNIALIKYWGKDSAPDNWPSNDSLSMTLSACRSETSVAERSDAETDAALDRCLYLGEAIDLNLPKHAKLRSQIERLRRYFGIEQPLTIETQNTFPQGAGLASSASGMAALTLAFAAFAEGTHDLDALLRNPPLAAALQKLARLGSGSACRSLYGGFVHWQRGDSPTTSSVQQVAEAQDWPLANLILLVRSVEKATPSSMGHLQARTSPLFAPRLADLPKRLAQAHAAIAKRSLDELGPIIEQEALDMHGIMSSQTPALHYLEAKTGEILAYVRELRWREGLPLYFTLDAGPNVHILCEEQHVKTAALKLGAKFSQLTMIRDKIGKGPEGLSASESLSK